MSKDKLKPQLTKFKEAAKNLTLKSATTPKKLKQFMAKHPSSGDQAKFDSTLTSMLERSPKAQKSSFRDSGGN